LSQLVVKKMPSELCEKLNKIDLRIVAIIEVMKMEVDSTLLEDVQKGQPEDEKIKKIKRDIKKRSHPDLRKTPRSVERCCQVYCSLR
jgi:hypothetical protein